MEGREKNDRVSVNVINLFVTCLFLFFAVQFSDGGGGFATQINKITADLSEAVSGLNQSVNYTDYNDTSVYVSNANFHSKGMAGLYNLSSMFIDVIVPKDILMEGLLYIDSNNQIQSTVPDPKDAFSYYRKIVAVILFLALCVLLFLLCGLCFCCCRCCGKCGARSQPADKKKDTCKKIILGTLLIVLGTGLLFCVVCAFGSNQQLQDGVDSFPSNMKNSLTDSKIFLDSTNNQVSHLLVQNYQEFSKTFLATMNDSSQIVIDNLDAYRNATAMTELYNFTQNLEQIRDTLYSLKGNSNKLRVYASQLNDALRKVKGDLLNTLAQCEGDKDCVSARNSVSTLTTNIDFNKLPDLNENIESLENLNISSIRKAAEEGRQQLNSIEQTINQSLSTGLTEAIKQISDTEEIIGTNLNSVTEAINEIKTLIDDNASPAVDQAQDYISNYGKYLYYVGLAVSCALLLVTLCIALGLICGICGKRPDGYSDNCCNKGAGGQFLICGVMIMFLLGFVVSVITIVMLIVGVTSEKVICDPIRNPNPDDNRIMKLLDSYHLQLDFDIKPSEVLKNCYNNQSLYITFNIKTKFDLDAIINNFNISSQLARLNINNSIPQDFKILNDSNLQILQELKTVDPAGNLDKFKEELKDNNFTNYSLTDLSSQLNDLADKISEPTEVKASLKLSVLHLNTYNEKLLVPMKNLADLVVNNSVDLDNQLKMGKGSFGEAIDSLLREINETQYALETEGPKQLAETAEMFKNIVLGQVNSYIDRVSNQIQMEIGRCGPLSVVINATLTSTCNRVLMPWNGFWFSLFWTIILYVIIIIVSVKLANLYQKYKPYGQYVETEYLYDAYADRGDSIPLNSRGAKRGKKKGKKSKRYEERPHGNEVAREYAAGSRPPDGRYADMAPKHWEEFPNGGPPHYQRAPTEYERPPPYYYPGSGGEQ